MANFTQPTSFNTSFLYENGGQISVASNGLSFTVNSGIFRTSDNSNDIILADPITIGIGASGFNGLDTGTLAASSLYDLYALTDPSDLNPSGVVFCLTGNTPYLPAGYGLTRYIGCIGTDGSGHFLTMIQIGNRTMRHYDLPSLISVYNGSGNGGSTYTALSLSSYVPANVRSVDLIVAYGANNSGNTFQVRPGGLSYGSKLMENSTTTTKRTQPFTIGCSSTQTVQWLTTSASDTITIYLSGFTDFI